MKTRLLKKQIAFIPITIAMLFFSAAHAQIVYTDVSPDQTFYTDGATYNLDLNNDGTNDFSIILSRTLVGPCGNFGSATNASVTITPLNANATVNEKKNSGDAINPGLSWSTSNLQLLASVTHVCHLCGNYPHYYPCWGNAIIAGAWSAQWGYLPLKLIVGTNTYYGWARLNMAYGGMTFTIKDYAYNSIPNSSILAGETGILSGISSPLYENNFSVFPNPSSDKILLAFSSCGKKEIQITNTLGQIVFYKEINSAKEEIDVCEFPAGVYVVNVQTAAQKIEKKFLKQ